MIADFLFFIAIAAICFSGLLFTLHNLGESRIYSLLALILIQQQLLIREDGL